MDDRKRNAGDQTNLICLPGHLTRQILALHVIPRDYGPCDVMMTSSRATLADNFRSRAGISGELWDSTQRRNVLKADKLDLVSFVSFLLNLFLSFSKNKLINV